MLTESSARLFIEGLLAREANGLELVRTQPDELGFPHHEMFPSQIAFLNCLIAMGNVTSILELGTFLGYSTIAMARAMDARGGGQLVTVDMDPRFLSHARLNVESAELVTEVRFIEATGAQACDTLGKAGRTFDLILLDVAETEYVHLYSPCVDLLSPGGTLVIDNVLMCTADGWETEDNVINGGSPVTSALRSLLDVMTSDPRVATSILPFGSGIALCVRTG